MNRAIVFDENAMCDSCGRKGAFDFYGDWLCDGCLAGDPPREGSGPNTVNHPEHYNAGAIEVVDAIEAWGLGFHLGNVVKYVARVEHKGTPLEDLHKARWYLDREITRREKP